MSLNDFINKINESDVIGELKNGSSISYKDSDHLYVSAANAALMGVTPENFVKFCKDSISLLNISECNSSDKLNSEWDSLLCARSDSSMNNIPSFDSFIYSDMPYNYCMHICTYGANAISCSCGGENMVHKLFNDKAIWISMSDKDFIPNFNIKEKILNIKNSEVNSNIYVCQNNGIFVGANTVEELLSLCQNVMTVVHSFDDKSVDKDFIFDKEKASSIAPEIRMLLKENSKHAIVTCKNDAVLSSIIASDEKVKKIARCNTVYDAIVFNCRVLFVKFCEDLDEQQNLVKSEIEQYYKINKYMPSVVVVEKTAVYAYGTTKYTADCIMDSFYNACYAACFFETMGSCSALPENVLNIISTSKLPELYKKDPNMYSRLEEKIVVVTGAAQGFGQGIAHSLLENGCNLVIADLNYDLALQNANIACKKYGINKSIAVKVNVSDEDSVHDLLTETVLTYGGIDLFVSNAGIARSGNIEQTTKQSLEFHIAVNYTGFFLCSKYASRIMKIQNKYDKNYYGDIIQINSKSGLEGSNKNFAYSGSKFGGLGLVQSFALELVEYNIKVNAICPGNFLDGPLWSDPVKGLFIQYLNSGKVPGAKSVEDVRKYYEAKVPMSRGCLPSDVATAVIYCCEQKYETGQAIPVTGGQVMLK